MVLVFFFQLKKMEESHQEATEKEVERILGLLQTHFKNDRKYDSIKPLKHYSEKMNTRNLLQLRAVKLWKQNQVEFASRNLYVEGYVLTMYFLGTLISCCLIAK